VFTAGLLGTALARRLAPGWSGAPLVLAASVAAVASLVVVSILTGLPGLFSAWTVIFGLALGSFVVLRAIPPAAEASGERPKRGDPAPRALVAFASASVILAATAALSATWERVGTGMTGFDSTWYHGPIAAEIARTGETATLHFTSPQFLTWFYPHGSELIHSVTGSAWGGDLPSLGLNIIFLVGCLLASWVLARPWGGVAGPVSVAGVAALLGCSLAFADQFGEARNDLAGTFFLLGGLALLASRRAGSSGQVRTAILVGLAAGLAAGTKLNFVPAALVLVAAPAAIGAHGKRARALGAALGGAALTGGFWYLRNLIQSGNPLPWTAGDRFLGITLPGPIQETGGRAPGSILDYALDGRVISDWFLPGLSEGFGPLWPFVLLLGLLAVVMSVIRPPAPTIRAGGLIAAAVVLAWLVGPTSASGPAGEPLGFVSGLRYLVPGLAISFALLGPLLADRDPRFGWAVLGLVTLLSVSGFLDSIDWDRATFGALALVLLVALVWAGVRTLGREEKPPRTALAAVAGLGLLITVGLGYGVASKYDRDRYRAPAFTVAGLDRAFAWSEEVGPGALATTATRSYPFRGPELDRRVAYPGLRSASGGLVPAPDCRTFKQVLNGGDFRYLVLSLDRQGTNRSYPREVRWLAGDQAARSIFREPPAAVFRLEGKLDPDGCR
jgi:hypothetical protein